MPRAAIWKSILPEAMQHIDECNSASVNRDFKRE